MAKLTVQMIVYSDEKESKYIPFLLDSLKKQTFQDWEMIVVDNNSEGKIISMVETALQDMGKEYRVIQQEDNIGFAAGHNVAYKHAGTPYTMLLNPDMYLMPDVFEKLVAFMDRHQQAAAVSCRLMRWDFAAVAAASEQDRGAAAKQGFTDSIDAIGVRLFRNRRAVEWQTREQWSANSDSAAVRKMFGDKILEVFGVSGAFVIFRKELLDRALLPGENLFDPTYHSYKEDLDLAYRLRNKGYTSYVLLDTVAYHDRTGAGPKKMSDWSAIKNKKTQSHFVSYHSYKNHLRTLYKNEYWQNVLIDLPFILWYELKKFGFLLLTNPKVIFGGWREIFGNWRYLREARRSIVDSRKMYWKGIRRWF